MFRFVGVFKIGAFVKKAFGPQKTLKHTNLMSKNKILHKLQGQILKIDKALYKNPAVDFTVLFLK